MLVSRTCVAPKRRNLAVAKFPKLSSLKLAFGGMGMSGAPEPAKKRAIWPQLLFGVVLMGAGGFVFFSSPEAASPELAVEPGNASNTSTVALGEEEDSSSVTAGLGLTLRRLTEAEKRFLRSEGYYVFNRSGALILSSSNRHFRVGDILLGKCYVQEVTLFDLLVQETQTLPSNRISCLRVLRREPGRPARLHSIGVGL